MNIHIANNFEKKSVFDLRHEVFVEEQNVPHEIEIDAEDKHAIHIIAEKDGITIGCARLIISQNEAHIGRLAVKKDQRGKGVGTAICRFIIDYCFSRGHTYIWLNSQYQAIDFYQKLGFVSCGDIFTEAGIEHVKMIIK